MGMPQLVVTAVLVEGRTKTAVARDYGVSRRWVITLVQRYLAEGDSGLLPRSRRPLRSPTRTADELENEIVAIRKDLDRHGHEAGAATIAAHLQRRHGTSPAVSTIWRILTARGFLTPSRTNGRRAATSGSRPPSPTNGGRPTSPTGRWPTAPTPRSATGSTTTPASAWPAPPRPCSPHQPSTPATGPSPPNTAIRPACSPTTAPSSPAASAAAAESCSR